jgi:hypothetical protein
LAAYNVLAAETCTTTFSAPTDIGGMTLVPGVYCFLSSAQLTGALTLDAGGDPSAVWVFKIASSLTTASSSSVVLINGAQACNAFWKVGSSATLGTSTRFIGKILALTSITLTNHASLAGSALAQTGAVTLDSNTVGITACAVPPVNPTLGKAFSPALINAGGSSTLTITLNNPNVAVASLTAPLMDTFPKGLTISGTASTTCGGALTALLGSSSVSLAGGSIPSLGSCAVTVPVTAALGGSYLNSLAIGSLQTSEGSNTVPAAVTLTVTSPVITLPTLAKSFSPNQINAGGSSTLTLTLANSNVTAATITAPLTDSLPSGLVVSGTASTTCGGAVTTTASQVTLTGGSIPAQGSCIVTLPVSAAVAGNYYNSLPAGALQTNQGNSAAVAFATLSVLVVNTTPSLTKSFSPNSIIEGGLTTLTITLSNSDDVASNLTAPLTDNLPTGLVIAGTASTTCGGTVTAIQGSSAVTLTGGAIPATGTCKLQVPVRATGSGSLVNNLPLGALVTSTGSNAYSAQALLTVASTITTPPTLAKAFNPTKINLGSSSTLTITLKNPGKTVSSLTAPLTDNFPQGLVILGSATTTCGGSVTAIPGSSVLTLTGGSIPAEGSCKVTVSVTGNQRGCLNNALPAGALQTSTGNNAQMVQASLSINCSERKK